MKKAIICIVLILVSFSLYAERVGIQSISTFQNNNVSNEDIIDLFKLRVISYFSQYKYFTIDYEVYNEPDEQNCAWEFAIDKFTFSNGQEIYEITYYFSNGYFEISFSNRSFTIRDRSAEEIVTFERLTRGRTRIITMVNESIQACYQEAIIIARMNSRNRNNEPMSLFEIQ